MHNLFGERFIGMRQPAWHELGIVSQDITLTPSQGFKDAGLDYGFTKVPVGYTLPDGQFVTSDKFALLRNPTDDDPQYRQVGMVSDAFSWLENMQIAGGLDEIMSKTGWTFETAGALGKGEMIFASLNAGTRSVFGDEYQQYFLVSDSKKPGRALRVGVTPVRVVCQNTLIASDTSSSVRIGIPHRENLENQYRFWTDLIASLQSAREQGFQRLEEMASVKISDEQAMQIIDRAYPKKNVNQGAQLAASLDSYTDMPAEEKEALRGKLKHGLYVEQYFINQVEQQRDAAFQLYERFNDGEEQGGRLPKKVLQKVAHTPYAALQAVTELCDWGGKGKDGKIAQDTLFGERANIKQTAWNAALEMAHSLA